MVEQAPRDPQNPAFLHVSYYLGERLLGLCKDECPATRPFRTFGHEVKSFHASYQIVRPFLQPPVSFVSEAGIDVVRKIHDGAMTICEKVTQDIQVLEGQLGRMTRPSERRSFLTLRKLTKRELDKRVVKFFVQQRQYSLERLQLRYANMLLNLMLTVLVYARHVHHDDASAAFPDTSSFLIADLESTLEDLRAKERHEKQIRTLLVEASWWWDGLVRNLPPLEELSNTWVNGIARWAVHPDAEVPKAFELAEKWREYSQNLQVFYTGEIDRLNAQHASNIAQVVEDRDKYAINNAGMRQLVDELNSEIEDLRADLATEKRSRQKDEERANRYKSERDRYHDKYRDLTVEKEEADIRASRWKRDYEHVTRVPQSPRSSHSRSSHRDSERSSHHRSSRRSQQGPPVAFETQRQGRRHSSSSSRRSNDSSVRWSGSSTAYEVSGDGARHDRYSSSTGRSESPPPVPRHTRPFRS